MIDKVMNLWQDNMFCLQDLMEIMLESLMVSERREYLQEEGLACNKCN